MTAKMLRISELTRLPIHENSFDHLELKAGVNVIVGELQAGKTTWLRMLDYILGDTGKLEEAFDADLAQKYHSMSALLEIENEELLVERRWQEPGAKSKIFLNGEKISPKEFSEIILGKLNIPVIHIPSGNPFERTWPELSWRELYRHFYKRERPWGGFAEKQTDVARSACILHFLNAARSLYPPEMSELIAKKKERERLEAQKDVFVGVMQDLAVDLVGLSDMRVAVTPDSLASSRERLALRLEAIRTERTAAFNLYDKSAQSNDSLFDKAKQRLETLYQGLGKIEGGRNDVSRRRSELLEYENTLAAELGRLGRAISGVAAFADLKVTHCPACEKPVPERTVNSDVCAVCGQVHLADDDNIAAGKSRIEFEQLQITEELAELQMLIGRLDNEVSSIETTAQYTQQQIHSEKQRILAAQEMAVRALPPEITILDQEVGQIHAQQEQIDRIERAIGTREQMSENIANLDQQIELLDSEVKSIVPTVDFSALGDLIGDRMNDYLKFVAVDDISRWKTGRVTVKLRRDSFDVYLNDQLWTVKAGGTANYLIQIAYHYALLSLSKDRKYNYPGFLIIDFPPHFSKANDLRGSENYLLKPFVDLCKMPEMEGAQVIIAGRAFDNLTGANIIPL